MTDRNGNTPSPFPLFTTQDWGEAIRKERRARGWSQAEFARMCGRRRQTIIDLEKGRNVSLYTFRIALITLGKGIRIETIGRVELERLAEILRDDDDEDDLES
ncbi:helix-turn-helix transcriptional regulator [Acidithiobacillus sp. IBUN Pt1247-S3]|uniref:helix-turn-helix transcriptional regulator n=1 Tax=Acidithiobacillus sp. IBUN Pt1247-S3 TaxID=3166642 RepID=UPI0034E52984